MNRSRGTVTFTEWKAQFNAGEDVSALGIDKVAVADGLAYGRVRIESVQGNRLLLAHFIIDAECMVVTAANPEEADYSGLPPLNDGVRIPDGPVAGFFWQDHQVENDTPFALPYYDPRDGGARGVLLLHQVSSITIGPYPGGFHDGELPGLDRPNPELLESVFL